MTTSDLWRTLPTEVGATSTDVSFPFAKIKRLWIKAPSRKPKLLPSSMYSSPSAAWELFRAITCQTDNHNNFIIKHTSSLLSITVTSYKQGIATQDSQLNLTVCHFLDAVCKKYPGYSNSQYSCTYKLIRHILWK
jgi:hypothetical protein